MAGVDAGTSETASKIAHAMKRHKKSVLSPCQKLLLLVATTSDLLHVAECNPLLVRLKCGPH